MTRPSVWHTLGRALGMVAALPARAVGLTIAHRPQLIPILIHARLLLDWRHTRKARRCVLTASANPSPNKTAEKLKGDR